MICCLNHWSFIKDPFDCNAGLMFTLPTARFQVWILNTPSWQAPIWIVLRRLEYERTDQHTLNRKRVELHQSFCATRNRKAPLVVKKSHWSAFHYFLPIRTFPSQMEMWNKSQQSDKPYIWCVRVTWLWWPLLLESKGVTWVRKT